jgi:hypothetical protein
MSIYRPKITINTEYHCQSGVQYWFQKEIERVSAADSGFTDLTIRMGTNRFFSQFWESTQSETHLSYLHSRMGARLHISQGYCFDFHIHSPIARLIPATWHDRSAHTHFAKGQSVVQCDKKGVGVPATARSDCHTNGREGKPNNFPIIAVLSSNEFVRFKEDGRALTVCNSKAWPG